MSKGDDLTTVIVPKADKIRSLNLPDPQGPAQPVAGHLYLFTHLTAERHTRYRRIKQNTKLSQCNMITAQHYHKGKGTSEESGSFHPLHYCIAINWRVLYEQNEDTSRLQAMHVRTRVF